MARVSRLDYFMDSLTDELEKGERKEWALKKLISLNLSMEMYERFEIADFASIFINIGFCTDLCRKLLQKIESTRENEQKESRKRRRSSCHLAHEDDEPAYKKKKHGCQDKKRKMPRWKKRSVKRAMKNKKRRMAVRQEQQDDGKKVYRRSTMSGEGCRRESKSFFTCFN